MYWFLPVLKNTMLTTCIAVAIFANLWFFDQIRVIYCAGKKSTSSILYYPTSLFAEKALKISPHFGITGRHSFVIDSQLYLASSRLLYQISPIFCSIFQLSTSPGYSSHAILQASPLFSPLRKNAAGMSRARHGAFIRTSPEYELPKQIDCTINLATNSHRSQAPFTGRSATGSMDEQ